MLDIAAICLVVAALFAYVNYRLIGLPTTIGVMVIALTMSLFIVGLDAFGVDHGLREYEASFVGAIDFSDFLMQGMLSFLLFAGALPCFSVSWQAAPYQRQRKSGSCCCWRRLAASHWALSSATYASRC